MLPSRRRFLTTLLAAPLAARSRALCLGGRGLSQENALRERLAADPLRPQCHLLPARNWMNDPNGPIFWHGRYHMFFQYNPRGAVWGNMHWAHAVSPDMIRWRHQPVALAPTPGWDDADGCFTGSAVDAGGTATVVYTGVKSSPPAKATLRDGTHNFREVQCLASSSDPGLLAWNKWKTPILEPPADPLLTGFRDPFLWRDGAWWYLGVGSGVSRQGGRVLLYRSRDLRQFEYLHPLASGGWSERENSNPVESGEMWECPDFFPLGRKHVLLYSTAGKVVWEVGELDPKGLVFHRERAGVLDHGAYYAQKTQLDRSGQRILWGWIPETRPEAEFSAAGWAGSMALPRLLSLTPENDLEMQIAPAARALRARAFPAIGRGDPEETRAARLRSVAIENLAGELRWTMPPAAFRLTLADQAGPWWSLTAEPSGRTTALEVNGKRIEVPTESGRTIEFHLVLDASLAEFFCDRLHALTSRIYRAPASPLELRFSGAGLGSFASLEAWQLRPISPDRLTS
jgi:beta-fructofuranosidase